VSYFDARCYSKSPASRLMRLIARPQVDRRDRGTLLKLRLRPTHPPALLARQPLTPMRRLPRHCRRQ
jgi:hypothetical protein